MSLSLYDLYKELKDKKILLYYSGPIDQASIEGVGHTLRRNLEINAAGRATSISVFSIFIEQVQNILNYSAEKLGDLDDMDPEMSIGVIVIGYEENSDYFICGGNCVYNEDISRIKSSIDTVNSLDKNELKALYKERRRQTTASGRKGTGLGLIEMARKSAQAFSYSFSRIDKLYSFFTIKVVVRR